jgi:hypothetical protein
MYLILDKTEGARRSGQWQVLLMTAVGHLRRFEHTSVTSAGAPKADIRLHRNI